MKKKGFTLAEILVTLGIIGIVAALTMPSLGRSASRAKIGPELSRAIASVENATQQFMNDYNANYLSVAMNKAGLDGRVSGFLNKLAEDGYLKGESFSGFPLTSEAYDGSTTKTDGVEVSNGLMTTGVGLLLPNKSGLTVMSECSLMAIEASGESPAIDKSDKCEILFVTSGFQKRDALVTGIDIFRVYLTNDGSISTGESGSCGENTTGVDCAGRIAKDGWKVTY